MGLVAGLELLTTPNVDHEFTFPTGLYSSSGIAQTIKYALGELAAFNALSFNLVGISSTEKVQIEVTIRWPGLATNSKSA